ncbi:mannonate dehydratase [Enterococcus faecium]
MEMTFRWYGANEEKISLQEIRQIPAMKGIVGDDGCESHLYNG